MRVHSGLTTRTGQSADIQTAHYQLEGFTPVEKCGIRNQAGVRFRNPRGGIRGVMSAKGRLRRLPEPSRSAQHNSGAAPGYSLRSPPLQVERIDVMVQVVECGYI